METRQRSPSRRTTRTRTRKSPVSSTASKSPPRKSPSRKSPSRKSPARKSPARKSPARKQSPEKLKNEKNEIKNLILNRSSPRNLKIRIGKNIPTLNKASLKEGSSQYEDKSLRSSISSTSRDAVDIGTSPENLLTLNKPEDTSGDSEIARITAVSQTLRRSASKTKLLTPSLSTHHLTPTPSVTATTELSRHSRSGSRSVFNDYSDDEIENETDTYSNYNQPKKTSFSSKLSGISRAIPVPKEFGGAIGAGLLLILAPLLTYYLLWSCEKTECHFKKITFELPNLATFEKLFAKDVVGFYILFHCVIFIASIIRIGRSVKLPLLGGDRNTNQFIFNLLFISIIITTAFIIGESMKFHVGDFIMKNYLKFLLFNILSAFTLSIWCYIRSYFIQQSTLNPYGKSGNFIVDFALGREINPKWFKTIDIKLFTYRTSIISTLVLLEALIYKNVQIPKLPTDITYQLANMTSDPLIITSTASETISYYYNNISCVDLSSLFSTIIVLIYVLDLIYFEHHLSTSFELQQEGVGALLLLRYAVTPFLLTFTPKYIFDKRPVNLSIWIIIPTIIMFTIGLYIKRKSNSIKYRYRLNPYDKDFSFVESVHTYQGKRLLLGNYWGRVRQPNYTGDIIALASIVLPLFGKFAWQPFISIELLIIFLIHRVYRLNERNFQRYNSAWTRYCTKVRYILIPKIF